MQITLATLKDATAQQVFDQVAAHMLKQNAQSRSYDGFRCMYRGADGLMCAAGCLISDEEYSPLMDKGSNAGGGNWANMVNTQFVPRHHDGLICSLQSLHDNTSPIRWKDELKRLAIDRDLSFTSLETM